MDINNKQNFHNYIDHKQNILFVAKLANGTIIGGFSTQALTKPDPNNKIAGSGKGFIFNMTLQRQFKLKNHISSPITNDAFYFILGNSQIRLRTNQKKILSNFGTTVAYFDPQGLKRTQFIGENASSTQQVGCQNYEFYQLEIE